ncbi:MAG: helix-turn-helix transcriptional regulator [Flavobacteriales bacterium]|nr:helix-turn-helix transcriptional regulator [Flavobacteriales bacterium]
MVCPRCLSSVRTILDDMQIEYNQIELGIVELSKEITHKQKEKLSEKLQTQGFELLSSRESKIINSIKSFVINKVHYLDSSQRSSYNLSDELSKELHISYSKLSKTFSRVEGITIEHYFLQQRIEKAKELLSYGEKTISEIAFDLGYSSTAHLSAQFKKITGMPPSAFKKITKNRRKSLDDI